MIGEVCGIKLSVVIPAFFGAVVYSLRVGAQHWYTRVAALCVGVITAMFLGPGIVEWFAFGPKVSAASIFLTGVGGAGIIEMVIGISKDPLGFYNRIRNK